MDTTQEMLDTIVVLYRDQNLGLWGIPYNMRADVHQQPRDLWDSNSIPDHTSRILGTRLSTPGPRRDWIRIPEHRQWTAEERAVIEPFLTRYADQVPQSWHEWCVLERSK